MNDHVLLSPAKVNLYLKVVGKRPDGYHDLVSVVDVISLYDVLHVRGTEDGAVAVADDRGLLPTGRPTRFTGRSRYSGALRDSRRASRRRREAHPPGSGLGGGSGNAAARHEGTSLPAWAFPRAGGAF